MIILVLTFLTLFLAIFCPCLVILYRCEQTKDFAAWKQRQQGEVAANADLPWRRNKQTLMG